jgi:hypothetical protein
MVHKRTSIMATETSSESLPFRLGIYTTQKIYKALRYVVFTTGYLENKRITNSDFVERAIKQRLSSHCQSLLSNYKGELDVEQKKKLQKIKEEFEHLEESEEELE